MARDEIMVEVAGEPVRISSPGKLMFPEQGWTKLDLVEHYVMCGEGALRGVHNRPTMLKRWNRGVPGGPLFVKRVPDSAPSSIDVRFPAARPGRMFLPREVGHVVWMAQQNCLDLNPWNARASDFMHPDEMRIDLDPTPDADFEEVREVAFVVQEILEEQGLVGWPKTSGSRGIHIYVRLVPEYEYIPMRRAVLALAREAERRHPRATTRWWKEERSGVFIDFNQNAWAKTVASAYSVRQTGLVSTPFRWEELATIDPAAFDLMAFRDRWDEVGDLTAGIDGAACRIDGLLEMVAADEARGLGDAPWPPHYPKQPGEPPRVQPSKRKQD